MWWSSFDPVVSHLPIAPLRVDGRNGYLFDRSLMRAFAAVRVIAIPPASTTTRRLEGGVGSGDGPEVEAGGG
jgi:hypothetical protein